MPDQDDLIVPLPGETEVSAERVGPKAATLARLHEAGLRVPAGFCVTAHAYRAQIAAAGVGESARRVTGADAHDARKLALQVRLGLLRAPLADDLSEALEAAYARL